jgi:hypothetical protein
MIKMKRLIITMLVVVLALSLILPASLAAQGRRGQMVKFEGEATGIDVPGDAPDGVLSAWDVGDQTVWVTAATNVIEAQGALEDGVEVMVLGFQEDEEGPVTALIIRVLNAPVRRAIPVFVRGEVTEIDLDENGFGTIVVAERTVIVDEDTDVEGELEVGVYVLVRGVHVGDDVLAKFIRVQPPRPAPDPEWGRVCDQIISGIVIAVPENDEGDYEIKVDDDSFTVAANDDTRFPNGVPDVDDRVRACVQELEDGALLARMIMRIDEDPGDCVPEELEFEGPIQRFPASMQGSWVIGGHHVVIDDTTVLEGEPGIGYHAEVNAVRCGQGVPHAVEIIITAPEPEPESEQWTFEGTVIRKPRGNFGNWLVDSTEFVVSAGTQMTGNPQVGDTVEVTVMQRGHGVLFALSVTLQESDDNGDDIPDPDPEKTPTIPAPPGNPMPPAPPHKPNRLGTS